MYRLFWGTSFPKKPQEPKIHRLYIWKMSVDVRRALSPLVWDTPTFALRQCYCAKSCLDLKKGLEWPELKKGFSRIFPTLLSLKQTIANSWFLIVRIGWFAVPPTNPAGCLDGIQSNTSPRSTVDRQRHTLGLGRSWNRSWNKGLGNHLWYSRSPFQTLCVCVFLLTLLFDVCKRSSASLSYCWFQDWNLRLNPMPLRLHFSILCKSLHWRNWDQEKMICHSK